MNTILQNVMRAEMNAIAKLIDFSGDRYDKPLEVLADCKGKVVFMGVGKSGHIGEKLAATFSSTGTPSFFVHATEAMHGDAGMIESKDIVILISNSGNTSEVTRTVPTLQAIGCVTMALTAGEKSTLAATCDYRLLYPKCDEADHLNLAPTVSSTLTLVLGDALACALSEKKGFSRDDFFRYHPGGALGQMLSGEKK